MLCAAAEQILESVSQKIMTSLNWRIRQIYAVHIFHSAARLDVPTWDDPVVAAQIGGVVLNGPNTVVGSSIMGLVQTVSTLVRLFAQTAILVSVLHEQRDGFLLSLLSFAGGALSCFNSNLGGDMGEGKRRL